MTGTYYDEEILRLDQIAAQARFETASHEAFMVQSNIDDMNAGLNPWSEGDADFVIPGPWKETACFYFDMLTGEALAYNNYAVSGDLVLTPEDLQTHWEQVEKADLAEMSQFVDHGVFSLEAKKTAGKNVIDAVWIRRWK